MYVISSFQVLTEGRFTLHNEHIFPHSVWMVYVDVDLQNGSTIEWKGLVTYLTQIKISLWLLNQIRDADN